MQLSASSGKNSLIAHCYFNIFGDSLDHSTDYPLADVVRNMNRWYHKAARRIWLASDTWEFDDENKTTLPRAKSTLVESQSDYSLPTDAFDVQRVEVLDVNGIWKKLEPITQSDIKIAELEFEKTDGLPKYYDLIGQSIVLYPAPTATLVTLTNGLRIQVSRTVDEFSVPANYTTADTADPGFDEDFHEVIPLGAALDYLLVNGPEGKADRIQARINEIFAVIDASAGRRNQELRDKIAPTVHIYE